MPTIKNIMTGSAVLGLVLALNACVVSPGPHSYYSEPHSHSSMVYWYYYPNYGVYYHPVDHYYYYQVGGIWRRDYRLPPGWVLTNEPRVQMQLSGIPYQKYSDHRRYYPPKRVINVAPPIGSGNGDRHDHQHRPDRDGRHGSNDSSQHRPEMDRKEGTNIFMPHTKESSAYDKRQRMEKSEQAGSFKGDNKSPLKELKKGSSYNATKSPENSKGKTQSKGSSEKTKQGKDDRKEKGKSKKDGDQGEDEQQSDSESSKKEDRRKEWYKGR